MEFSIVSTLILCFLSTLVYYLTIGMGKMPVWLDRWIMCYTLEHQITRIIGLNPGGIWDAGFYYPFHKVSLLFDESSWGTSLLVAPVWIFTKNIFPIFKLGGIPALFLAWISMYYFVKSLGGLRIWAFFAGATFCLSGIALTLISQATCFWIFFLVPLLGIVTLKIFSTSKLYWGVLWGLLYGYLAWASAHIFVMGGLFLCFLVAWNLIYNNRSKKTILALLVAFIISAVIASAVLAPMYFTYKRFGFFRGYYEPYLFSSNFFNLIYRNWPFTPFNPIAKTPFWYYLKIHARGETQVGVSLFLFISALIIFITRLKQSDFLRKANKHSKYVFIVTVISSILFALLNMRSLIFKCMQLKIPPPELATGLTYLFYIIAGIIIYILSARIKSATKHLDFFFLLAAFFFGLLSFGSYYLTKNNLVIASPVAFLQYHVLGFSGIRATARWGLMFSFTLSIAVAIFLSKHKIRHQLKVSLALFVLLVFLELTPKFQMPEFKNLSPYKWEPRQTDIFLKNLPGDGAVLEMETYPFEQEQVVISDNSRAYSLFSRLYHKKPLVTGYSSFLPHVTNKYLFFPKNKTLSSETINTLRKFGARYWVFHINNWPLDRIQLLKSSVSRLNKIAELDNGKTLVYEDPNPNVSLGYYDVK